MQLTRLAYSAAALLGLAAVTAVLFVAVQVPLGAVGVREWVAYPTAVGAVLPPVLAFADAYAPFGNASRTTALRDRPVAALATDAAIAALAGVAVGYVGGRFVLSGDATSLAEIVVVFTAVVVGYVAFIARNIDVYSDGRQSDIDGEVQP